MILLVIILRTYFSKAPRPPSRVSFVQGINPVQNVSAQAQKSPTQVCVFLTSKDIRNPIQNVQPPTILSPPVLCTDSSKEVHVRVRLDDPKTPNIPIDFPLEKVTNARSNVGQEAGRSQIPPGDGKNTKTFPDPLVDLSKEHVSSVRETNSAQPRTDFKMVGRMGPDGSPASIPLNMAKGARLTFSHSPSQTQNGTPSSVNMEIERQQVPLVGPNSRPCDSIRTRGFPTPKFATSVLPIPNLPPSGSSTTSRLESGTQVLSSQIVLPLNRQSKGNAVNASAAVLTSVAQNAAPTVGPPPPYSQVTSAQEAGYVPSHSPANVFPSVLPHPHNRGSLALPVPSETFPAPYSAPLVNTFSSLHVLQSSANVPAAVQRSSFTVQNLDRNVPARDAIRQFGVSAFKGDVPLLLKNKDESKVTSTFVLFNELF